MVPIRPHYPKSIPLGLCPIQYADECYYMRNEAQKVQLQPACLRPHPTYLLSIIWIDKSYNFITSICYNMKFCDPKSFLHLPIRLLSGRLKEPYVAYFVVGMINRSSTAAPFRLPFHTGLQCRTYSDHYCRSQMHNSQT